MIVGVDGKPFSDDARKSITRDQEILPSIEKNALLLARGQSMYGPFGHGFAALPQDRTFNGSVPPYGPVNTAGLPANLAIVLVKKCGVMHPEIDQAIGRDADPAGCRKNGGHRHTATPAIQSILEPLVATAEPSWPIRWEDPVRNEHAASTGLDHRLQARRKRFGIVGLVVAR